MASNDRPWYLRSFTLWGSFRTVPFSRLWMLLLAATFLFSIIGFYSDLRSDGTYPYAVALAIAAVTGLNAALWIIAVARLPALALVLLTLLQFYIGAICTKLGNWMVDTFHLHDLPPDQGIHFAANCMLFVSIASYVAFVTFIRTEGRRALRIQNELELAHSIQRTLVPTLEIRTSRFELYGISRPSEKVGGDLVDAVLLPGGDVVAFLADITGHGLPASILMGRVKTAARTALLDANERPAHDTLPVLLNRLNTVLPQVKEPQMFATFTAFRLCGDGAVFCALAASPPVVHWHASAQSISHCEEPQFPVGLFPVSHFDSFPLETCPGDLFVVATDGILEVANKHSEDFGIERLNSVVISAAQEPLPQLAAKILNAARSYGRQLDDQTLLLVRCL